MKKWTAIAVVAVFFLVGSTAVLATMDNMKAFNEKYPDAKAKLGKCTTCHAKPLPKKGDSEMNPFGTDVKSTLDKDKKPDFSKIEQKDSDGDGVKNIDEIKAGTNPGDKNAK